MNPCINGIGLSLDYQPLPVIDLEFFQNPGALPSSAAKKPSLGDFGELGQVAGQVDDLFVTLTGKESLFNDTLFDTQAVVPDATKWPTQAPGVPQVGGDVFDPTYYLYPDTAATRALYADGQNWMLIAGLGNPDIRTSELAIISYSVKGAEDFAYWFARWMEDDKFISYEDVAEMTRYIDNMKSFVKSYTDILTARSQIIAEYVAYADAEKMQLEGWPQKIKSETDLISQGLEAVKKQTRIIITAAKKARAPTTFFEDVLTTITGTLGVLGDAATAAATKGAQAVANVLKAAAEGATGLPGSGGLVLLGAGALALYFAVGRH